MTNRHFASQLRLQRKILTCFPIFHRIIIFNCNNYMSLTIDCQDYFVPYHFFDPKEQIFTGLKGIYRFAHHLGDILMDHKLGLIIRRRGGFVDQHQMFSAEIINESRRGIDD